MRGSLDSCKFPLVGSSAAVTRVAERLRQLRDRMHGLGAPLYGVSLGRGQRIVRKLGVEGHATFYLAEAADDRNTWAPFPLLVKAYRRLGPDAPAELRDLPLREAHATSGLLGASVEACGDLLEERGHWLLCFRARDGLLPLGEWIRTTARAVPTVDVMRHIEVIANGLAKVHRADLVHRNLGARSVLLPREPRWREAVLSDFSKAKFLSGEHVHLGSEPIGGARGYLSPEQRAGDPNSGPPSDIYVLGRLCYEIFAGRPLDDAFFDRPPLLFDFRDDLPSEFVFVARACLARRPTERPTADEVRAAASAAQISIVRRAFLLEKAAGG